MSYGFAFDSARFNSARKGNPLIRIRDISRQDTEAYIDGPFDPFYIVKNGDYLVGMDGDFNVRRWAGVDALLNQRVMRMRNWSHEVLASFVVLPLQEILNHLHGETSLTTVKHLSAKQINGVEIPLPPLAEQHRIVAKVEELMALLDRLEAARAAREDTRTRLTAATLSRLTEANTDTPTAARFALQTLPALTTRPDQIKTLRQTILNLAVRGKLVGQDPADEPASELLKSIGPEIVRRRQEMGLRKQEPLEAVNLDHEPFQLPAGWTWARFPEVGVFARGKSKHRPRNDMALYVGGDIPFVQTGDVARSNGKIETYSSTYNARGLAQSMLWPSGTMCVTIAANIADSGILTFNACFPDSVVGLLVASPFKDARFFEYFVRTAKANLTEFAPATAQKNINLGILETVLIPLPPLAEQHRIVAKVEELMSVCDRLERALQDCSTARARLLDTTIREALVTTNDPEVGIQP